MGCLNEYINEIEKLRTKLHDEIARKNDFLCDEEILRISRELDACINHYYEEMGIHI